MIRNRYTGIANKRAAALVALMVLLSGVGCVDRNPFSGPDYQALQREEQLIHQELDSLKLLIRAEWDSFNRKLEGALPETLPEDERRNMLHVRNAGLIRMFESFALTGDEVSMALDQTAALDEQLARRVVVLKDRLHAIQQERGRTEVQRQESGTGQSFLPERFARDEPSP